MISAMDTQIGDVTHMLQQTEMMEDTVVIFTSDNGAPFGAAFGNGDEPEMMDNLGLVTRDGACLMLSALYIHASG